MDSEPFNEVQLSVDGLVKRVATRAILQDIGLTVRSGELITTVGPSGSGKSTLLACIAGLEPVDAGQVWVGGIAVHESRRPRRELLERSIGILFQNYGLVEEWTVEENLGIVRRLPRRDRQARKEQMSAALAQFGLSEAVLDTKAATLSGGEQQRVALSMLWLQRPQLLLADEPSSALDDVNCERLIEFFEAHLARGGAALVATHDHRIIDRFGLGVALNPDGTQCIVD